MLVEFVTMSGHRNAFHEPIALSNVIVMIAGMAMGTMICHKKRQSDEPSIRAAYPSSSGTDLKNCLNRKIQNIDASHGIISASYWSIQPKLARVTKFGMSSISPGIIIVAISTANSTFFPKNCTLLNA